MQMTRKHFEIAAAKLAAMPDRQEARTKAEIMAEAFAAQNPRFDMGRFLTACKVG